MNWKAIFSFIFLMLSSCDMKASTQVELDSIQIYFYCDTDKIYKQNIYFRLISRDFLDTISLNLQSNSSSFLLYFSKLRPKVDYNIYLVVDTIPIYLSFTSLENLLIIKENSKLCGSCPIPKIIFITKHAKFKRQQTLFKNFSLRYIDKHNISLGISDPRSIFFYDFALYHQYKYRSGIYISAHGFWLPNVIVSKHYDINIDKFLLRN